MICLCWFLALRGMIQTSDVLYFEALDLPLPELQGLKTLKVAFHNSKTEEVGYPTLRDRYCIFWDLRDRLLQMMKCALLVILVMALLQLTQWLLSKCEFPLQAHRYVSNAKACNL